MELSRPDSALRFPAPAALRSVYLWAGRATVDLQRVKLPDIPVDEAAHEAAYAPAAAQELANNGLNCAFLSMNWGFPPEIERAHWDDFARAADVYRAAGFRVLGYVQASNCVAAGSYAGRDWYARTPDGRAVPYYAGRRMTCLNHPDWLAEVHAHARRVLDLGGDGVFFDNIWMGATAWVLGGRVGGFAGCACERCRAAYRAHGGREIPARLDPGVDASDYLEWRAGIVARRLGEWGAAIRERRADAWVLANNCDVVLRDSIGLLGIDPPRVARAQDALLVENIAMARYRPRQRRLIANALPIRALQALVPDRAVLALTYENGIGLDGRPSGTRLCRALAEAVAVGASPVLKGSEFLDTQGRMTVLTAPDFAPMRQAAGGFLRWVHEHEHLYRDAVPAPDFGIYLDAALLRERWSDVAPATFAVAVALLREAVPFAFYTREALESGSSWPPIVIPPGVAPPDVRPGVALVPIAPDEIDIPAASSPALGHAAVRRIADWPLRTLARYYFGSPWVRRLVDRSGLTARFLESALFTVPHRSAALRHRLGPAAAGVESSQPVLVERRRRADGVTLLHLVNYSDEKARVVIRGAGALRAWYSPDPQTSVVSEGGAVWVELTTYVVLEWAAAAA
jgi:hypothetical protein